MKTSSPKVKRLMNQYPFLRQALFIADLEEPSEKIISDITIKVEKADGDLVYRQADNVGPGDGSFVFQLSGKHEKQVAKKAEHLFAIDANDKVINRVRWPRNRKEQRQTEKIYGWTVLWGTRNSNDMYSDPLYDKVEYLIWITVEAWYKDTEDDNNRFGELVERNYRVTIYKKPSEGFDKLVERSCPQENLYLTTDVIIRGYVDKDSDLLEISGRLAELCQLFQEEVYFNGMKDILDKGNVRGASGKFGSVEVLCAEMCGYDRVMLQDSSSYVTFQLRPEGRCLYVLGQGGRLPQIRNLVKTVMKIWNNPENRTAFQSDGDIRVM